MGRLERLQRGKKALAMASRLDGPAFECYERMSEEHQKDPAVVADELKQEFVKAERDRDTAIHELTGRSWRPGESPASFAHDICRLAKLAYPGFGADALDTIARDCFFERTTTGATRGSKARPANYNQEGSRPSRRSRTITTSWGGKHDTADCTRCPGNGYIPGCISS